jgi:hypothetical protein
MPAAPAPEAKPTPYRIHITKLYKRTIERILNEICCSKTSENLRINQDYKCLLLTKEEQKERTLERI